MSLVAVQSDSQLEVANKHDQYDKQVAELEEQLVVERRRADDKEKECASSREMLFNLERRHEQERIAALEKMLTEQGAAAEKDAKVEKLLLAVVGEKQRAQERSKQIQVMQEHLQAEEQRRAESDRKVAEQAALIEKLQNQHGDDQDKRNSLASRLAEKEQQVADMHQHFEELQLQLAGLSVRPGLDVVQEEDEGGQRLDVQQPDLQPDLAALQERLTTEEEKRKDAEFRNKEGEDKLRTLNEQFAEELTKRQRVQDQLVEKERQLSRRPAEPGEEIERQRAAQDQVIQKEREVCDLQQQLADELAKRREVQHQSTERDRQLAEKDRQIAELREELAAARAEGSTRRIVKAGDHPPKLVLRQMTPSRNASFDDEALDLPPGPPLETQVVGGHAVPVGYSRWPGVPLSVHSVPVLSASHTPGESQSRTPVHGQSASLVHTRSSMTFSSATLMNVQMRQRAYKMPGVPQWTTGVVAPTAAEHAALARRLATASRTYS